MKPSDIQKVLIALDYDPTAQKVAETGFSFAQSLGAEITLLHVVNDPVYYTAGDYDPIMGFTGYLTTDPMLFQNSEELKKAAMKYLESTRNHLGNADIKLRVEEGDTADSIILISEAIQADILVLGSHSRRWLEEILMGSVTEKILHHTTIPVLVVPTKKQEQV